MDKIPYAMVVGYLMYVMVITRPDLAHSLSVLSRYMSNPGQEHWPGVKCLMRYLKGTINYGLIYKRRQGDIQLTGYVDSDFASNQDLRRSLTSYVYPVSENCVSWKSQLQQVIASSTT
ncbi:secreted RxLR effector protein 161-like [Humulus lupulus]|uniref:secreted RxLR effector protein 161-like n=1 Tax=Humulus lupulus TaxID=3486 RepID=UPI002B4137E5|nr:secreted RxLR effector protein 161-like [Humulus lupulus]